MKGSSAGIARLAGAMNLTEARKGGMLGVGKPLYSLMHQSSQLGK